MSILNNETGREELTIDGAEAVLRGIHYGTVTLDSPALQGIFIPREMRTQIQTRVLEEMTERYMDLGFPAGKATSLAKEEYYGQAFGEPEQTGFADILWSDAIPSYPNQKYYQLNTVYMLGPNSRPIATGIKKSVFAALGLPWFHHYHAGQTSNMGVDARLNSVDEVRGANLGMRALYKFDESWEPETPEKIAKGIEDALEEILEKLDDLNDPLGRFSNGYGYRGGSYYRRSFGGGGGGGWSSNRYNRGVYVPSYDGRAERVSPQRRVRTPYVDTMARLNTSNPIIRRANIRRERFASQRGRLNQWQ